MSDADDQNVDATEQQWPTPYYYELIGRIVQQAAGMEVAFAYLSSALHHGDTALAKHYAKGGDGPRRNAEAAVSAHCEGASPARSAFDAASKALDERNAVAHRPVVALVGDDDGEETDPRPRVFNLKAMTFAPVATIDRLREILAHLRDATEGIESVTAAIIDFRGMLPDPRRAVDGDQ